MYLNHYQADTYDVIVVGAGHAGSEAAFGCSQNGLQNVITNYQPRHGSVHAM